MKKIFLLSLCFLILQVGTVFAFVEKHTDKGVRYTMEYPIVYTNNKAAQDKINQDIYHYIAAFRNDYHSGKFNESVFYYAVTFEDENYISLKITSGGYIDIVPDNLPVVYGLVYDKKTGRKLPLSYFLKITLSDLKSFYHYNSNCEIYSESNNKSDRGNLETKIGGTDNKDTPREVSKNYYLLGNGVIALVYEPYEISIDRYSSATIRINAADVAYFNRKNRNL